MDSSTLMATRREPACTVWFRQTLFLLTLMAGAALCALPDASGQAPDTLKRAGSGARAPHAEGFIQRWLLLDPLPVAIRSNRQLTDSFVQEALKREYFPGQFTAIPKDGDKVTVNGADLVWHAMDAPGYNINLFHFAYDRKKPAYNAIYWAFTIIQCPRDMPNVRLSVGSNSASIWWLNGEEVIDLYGDRHMLAEDGISRRLTLRKGPNTLRAAVINAPGLSNMCARFLDAEDKPLKGFTVTLEDAGAVSSAR